MIRLFRKRGLTLTELILAILLLNIVVFTGISMEMGLRRIFISSDYEVELLGQATPILSMIMRDINRAIGSPTSLPYSTTALFGNPAFRIRIDSNPVNGKVDATDGWVAYSYTGIAGGSAYQLRYYPNAAVNVYQVLSDRVTNFSVSAPVNGTSDVLIQLRRFPSSPINATNPEIMENTSVQFRGYPLS